MKTVDWTKWSAIAEIFGAIAIVVTLLYLAVQTQYLAEQTEQNNEFLAAQADYNILQNRTSLYVPLMLDSRALADLLAKVQAGGELDAAERIQLATFQYWFLNNWEWEFGEFYAGRLREEDLPIEPWRDALRGLDPVDFGLLEYWEESKYRYPPEFQEYMDDFVIPGL